MVLFNAEVWLNKMLTIFTYQMVVYNNNTLKFFFVPNLNTVQTTFAIDTLFDQISTLLHYNSYIILSGYTRMCFLITLPVAAFYIDKIYSNLKVFS